MHNFSGIEKNRKLIVGVGSALLDILLCEDENFLIKTGAAKGGMTYVQKEFIEQSMANSSKNFRLRRAKCQAGPNRHRQLISYFFQCR